MGIPDRGQPGADVDELAHPLARYPGGGALVIAPVRPRCVPDLGHCTDYLLSGYFIHIEVAMSPSM